MSTVKELLRTEADGTLSFGDYELEQKTKLADYEFKGDLYKVKTFKDITKLEKNGALVYESDPGTAVTGFAETEDTVAFTIETPEDAQVILGLWEDADCKVTINGEDAGLQPTGMGGKLVLSIPQGTAQVRIEKA